MAKNDITGDEITSRTATPIYRENYDKIFRKKDKDINPPHSSTDQNKTPHGGAIKSKNIEDENL